MGALVVTVPLGILTLIVYLASSSTSAEWLVWCSLTIWSVFALIKSYLLHKSFLEGVSLKGGEVIAMVSQPIAAAVTLAAIIILLFVTINKIHLLWFYLGLSILCDFTVGIRAVRKLEAGREKL